MINMLMPNPGEDSILLLNDDGDLLTGVARVLESLQRPIMATQSIHQAENYLFQHHVAVFVCEPKDINSTNLLIRCRTHFPETMRLLLASYADLNEVLKAANQVSPFKLLIKPWLNEELLSTVSHGLSQCTLEKQRSLLIAEYSGVRSNAERSHAFNTLNALVHSIHRNMAEEALHHLPVAALIWKANAIQASNSAASQILADLHDAPMISSNLFGLIKEMVQAPRRQRMQMRLSTTDILAYAVIDLEIGTLVIFTFEAVVGHPLTPT